MKRNPKEVSNEEFPIFNLLVRAGYVSDEELAEIEKNRKELRWRPFIPRVHKRYIESIKTFEEMDRIMAARVAENHEEDKAIFFKDLPEDDEEPTHRL